jgi:hypothetical protein
LRVFTIVVGVAEVLAQFHEESPDETPWRRLVSSHGSDIELPPAAGTNVARTDGGRGAVADRSS